MKIKRRRSSSFDSSSALSDLAFLLIIYFIVTATFNTQLGLLLNLPQKDTQRFVEQDALLNFEFDHAGSLLFRGTVIDYEEAAQRIRTAQSQKPDLAVVLTIAPRTPWQQVVSFVELAQKLEVKSFSFSMKEQDV